MSRIQKRDFYFGAALSLFLSRNNDSRPSLIECSETSCQYCMITDTSEDFYLYMKYCSHGSMKQNEKAWQFTLTDTDKERINHCIWSGLKTYIVLICGSDNLSEGEIVVLTQAEFLAIAHKTGIRIKLLGKSPKKYVIADRQSSRVLTVDRNRFDYKLTDIRDSLTSGG